MRCRLLLTYAEAEQVALRGAPEAAHAAGLGPVKAEEGAAAGLKDLALVDVERRLRIRVVVLAHRGGERVASVARLSKAYLYRMG